ncbi:MAG: BrnA antitoxin family protein [Gallionella sp.]|jgi:uncharacterized protein (DUF4415 family)|nr:BrnA antitoxin family protein [Gallionella sp.]MCK9354431.1 BrnA antitoxin family protein [Gallionella sp.]
MKSEYDFSKAKRAKNVPHLAKLQAENAAGKTRVTMYLDAAVVQAFRNQSEAEGKGYQTLINDALRRVISQSGEPMTEERLRQIIREEIKAA